MAAKILLYDSPTTVRTYEVGEIYKFDTSRTTTDVLDKSTLILHHIHNQSESSLHDKLRIRSEKKLYSKLIFDYPFESVHGFKLVTKFLESMKDYRPYLLDIFYIINRSNPNRIDQNIKDIKILRLDFFAADIYHRFIKNEIKTSSMSIYQRPRNLNVLVGKTHTKISRLFTVYRLYKDGLLDDEFTGIINTWEDFNNKQNLIHDSTFWEWLKTNLGPVDYPVPVRGMTGYPYDVKTYDYTKVSMICETHTDEFYGPGSFITEKTYKPIINRSPFIMQGFQSQLDHLRGLGFNTYEKYLSNQDYLKRPHVSLKTDEFTDCNHARYEYIRSLPIHVKELLDACTKHESEISKIALENKLRLLDHGKSEKQKLVNAFNQYMEE